MGTYPGPAEPALVPGGASLFAPCVLDPENPGGGGRWVDHGGGGPASVRGQARTSHVGRCIVRIHVSGFALFASLPNHSFPIARHDSPRPSTSPSCEFLVLVQRSRLFHVPKELPPFPFSFPRTNATAREKRRFGLEPRAGVVGNLFPSSSTTEVAIAVAPVPEDGGGGGGGGAMPKLFVEMHHLSLLQPGSTRPLNRNRNPGRKESAPFGTIGWTRTMENLRTWVIKRCEKERPKLERGTVEGLLWRCDRCKRPWMTRESKERWGGGPSPECARFGIQREIPVVHDTTRGRPSNHTTP